MPPIVSSPSDFDAALDLEASLPLRGAVPVSVDAARVEDEVLRLFDACAGGLRRYVASLGVEPASVDDVVQEVFLALYRHLRLGRSRENLKGWVFQVGHNLALKHRQCVRRLPLTAWTAGTEEALVDPARNPEERMAGDQRQARLRAVLRALPERDRRCLYLRAEGFRYRDIARILGVSLGSVAKSVARGLARLTSADHG